MTYLIYLILICFLVCWLEQPCLLGANLLNMRKRPDEELEQWLKKFSWGRVQKIEDTGHLPQYKFYTEIVSLILYLARKIGGNYRDSLLFLREGLQIDRQFEKRVSEVSKGLYLQMLLVIIVTWGFVLGAHSLVKISIHPIYFISIFLWQISGVTLMPLSMRILRKKYFGDIGQIWKILYVLKSLVKIPLPRSEVMSLAGISDLDKVHQNSLETIVLKLKEVCQKALKHGTSYEDDIKYLMGELRFQESWHFELFEKKLLVIKLILLSVFFLPSYLAFLFLLLRDLTSLM